MPQPRVFSSRCGQGLTSPDQGISTHWPQNSQSLPVPCPQEKARRIAPPGLLLPEKRSPASAGLRSTRCYLDQPRNGFGSGTGSGTGQPSGPTGWPAVLPRHLSSQLFTPSPSSSRSAQVLAGGGTTTTGAGAGPPKV